MVIGTSFLLILFSIYMLGRNEIVSKLRVKLLEEEADWAKSHLALWATKSSLPRYESLPSYQSMFWHFWKPVYSYEKGLKPIEEYYKRGEK
jgi:hypothetical protein